MSGHRPFRELVAKMSPEAQEKIKRGTEKILAELELHELREAMNVTQIDLAHRLKTTQAAISRLEKTDQNVTVRTLTNYAEALGGKLQLCVVLADRTIQLTNLVKPRPAIRARAGRRTAKAAMHHAHA